MLHYNNLIILDRVYHLKRKMLEQNHTISFVMENQKNKGEIIEFELNFIYIYIFFNFN